MPRYGPYKSYNNSVTLWFDSESHTYLREYGEELVPQRGVTTILRIIDKSEYLIPWAAKVVTAKLATIMPTVDEGLDVYTQHIHMADFLELCDKAKKAPREILDDAGDVGSDAHRSLEDSIRYAINTTNKIVEKLVNIPKDPRAVSCCNAALSWMRAHNVRWECTERKIYSREYEFAGTMDGLAIVSSCSNPICCPVHFTDRLSIIDWKSSNQLSVSYLAQVAAYRYAYQEETEWTPKVDDAFILRLGKEDGEFEPWHTNFEELDQDFQYFLGCMRLTSLHEDTKYRMAEAMKARTVRKRAVKAAEKEAEKVAAKAEKLAAKEAKKKEKNGRS